MVARRRSPRSRADASKVARKSLVIVTEGTETEPAYLKALRGWFKFGQNVHVVGLGADPCTVVKVAAVLRSDLSMRRKYGIPDYVDFDEAWAVFDKESDPSKSKTVEKAIVLARQGGVYCAASNPCFEYWLVLHFVDHAAPFQTSKAAKQVLLKHHPQFSKSTPASPTNVTLPDAVTRAVSSRDRHLAGVGDGNPSTNVDQLIASLVEAASPSVSLSLIPDAYDESAAILVCGVKSGA